MILLQLDYQAGSRPFPWAGAGMLAVAALALALIAAYYQDMAGKIEYWNAKAGIVDKGHGHTLPGPATGANEVVAEIKHANEVLRKITLPWDALFQAVEWSSGKDVALLAMEPDAERRVVKISAEAKNVQALMSYMRHLEEQKIFSSVYLQSHQVQLKNPEKPVRFTLVASWAVTP